MKKRYTYSYIKTVVGKVTVTADSDEDAENDATEFLEKLDVREGDTETETPQEIEVGLLDLKDVEPANFDDNPDE